MSLSWLLYITDSRTAPTSIVEIAGRAAQTGATHIQIREGHLTDREVFDLTRAILRAVESTPARVLVNERFDVALAAGAHGVHLKDRGLDPAEVRDELRRQGRGGFLIGVSCHDAPGLALACSGGAADFATVSPLHGSAGKPGMELPGLTELLDRTRRLLGGPIPIPWLALGGVSPSGLRRLSGLERPGEAWGVAAIRAFQHPISTQPWNAEGGESKPDGPQGE